MIVRTVLFLLVNFAALGVGSVFTGNGVRSAWYQGLEQAPWTPPGWMFGVAWTSIMVFFSIYMALLWKEAGSRNLVIGLFVLQWILNVAWNPVFFKFHAVAFGLVIIAALTVLMGYFFFHFLGSLKAASLLVLPYFVWLIVATSLNAYILLHN